MSEILITIKNQFQKKQKTEDIIYNMANGFWFVSLILYLNNVLLPNEFHNLQKIYFILTIIAMIVSFISGQHLISKTWLRDKIDVETQTEILNQYYAVKHQIQKIKRKKTLLTGGINYLNSIKSNTDSLNREIDHLNYRHKKLKRQKKELKPFYQIFKANEKIIKKHTT